MRISLENLDQQDLVPQEPVDDEAFYQEADKLVGREEDQPESLEAAVVAVQDAATLSTIAENAEKAENPSDTEVSIYAASVETITSRYDAGTLPAARRGDKAYVARAARHLGKQLQDGARASCEGFFDNIGHGMGKIFTSKSGLKPKFDEAIRSANLGVVWRSTPFYNEAFMRDFPSRSTSATPTQLMMLKILVPISRATVHCRQT